MSEIRGTANGEIYKGDGTEIKSAGGKTYVISGIASSEVAYDNSQSSLDAETVQEAIDKIAELLPGKIENWRQVQDVVRRGLASSYFKIGDTFEVKKGQSTLLFDLIGIDEDIPASSTAEVSGTGITAVDVDYFKLLKQEGVAGEFEFNYHNSAWRDNIGDTVTLSDYGITATGTAAEGDTISVSIPHSITLEIHNLFGTVVAFGARQAAFYVDETTYPTGLAAGTYNFTWSYSAGSLVSGTYQFTLAEAVPVGGQIVIDISSTNTALTSCKISTYGTVGSTTAIETDVVITEGTSGTDLGTIDGATISDTHTAALLIINGEGSYSKSSVKQFINSDKAANTWWQPQSNFDRPSNADKNGFLYGVDEAFLGVIGTVIKTTTKTYLEGSGLQTSTEKVFLLSRAEVYGGEEDSTADGIPYSYYKDFSDLSEAGTGQDSNRIKKFNNQAKAYSLRTPIATSANLGKARIVQTAGQLSSLQCKEAPYIAPAVVIY